MKFNFENGDYLDEYRCLLEITGKINRDEEFVINRKDYPEGYALFGFDLSASQCGGSHQEPQKNGSVRISLEFSITLANTVTVLAYAEFDNTIAVTKTRNILKDY